jgi:hypothetical protein
LFEVLLSSGSRGRRVAYLRDLCGQDELWVEPRGSLGVTDLIERLLVDVPGAAVCAGTIDDLTLSDRDLIVAALYGRYFGDRIEAALHCRSCGEVGEVSFSMRDLVETSHGGHEIGSPVPGPGGWFLLDGRNHFRLPTCGDERAVAGLEPPAAMKELRSRCVGDFAEGAAAVDLDEIDRLMEAAGPVLATQITTVCSTCDFRQPLALDIAELLIDGLVRERAVLTHEVHHIAVLYHWDLDQILRLPREQRRSHVALALAERGRAAGGEL